MQSNEEDDLEDLMRMNYVSRGNIYPLNSKKLAANQLHRLAGMLGLKLLSSSTGLSMLTTHSRKVTGDG